MGKIIKNTIDPYESLQLVAGLGLGLAYEVTKEPIAQNRRTGKRKKHGRLYSRDAEPGRL